MKQAALQHRPCATGQSPAFAFGQPSALESSMSNPFPAFAIRVRVPVLQLLQKGLVRWEVNSAKLVEVVEVLAPKFAGSAIRLPYAAALSTSAFETIVPAPSSVFSAPPSALLMHTAEANLSSFAGEWEFGQAAPSSYCTAGSVHTETPFVIWSNTFRIWPSGRSSFGVWSTFRVRSIWRHRRCRLFRL